MTVLPPKASRPFRFVCFVSFVVKPDPPASQTDSQRAKTECGCTQAHSTGPSRALLDAGLSMSTRRGGRQTPAVRATQRFFLGVATVFLIDFLTVFFTASLAGDTGRFVDFFASTIGFFTDFLPTAGLAEAAFAEAVLAA